MAFVFRSKRDFNYQQESSIDSYSVNSPEEQIIQEKQKLLINKYNKISNNNKKIPFSSSSEKISMKIKEKDTTPGPGSYNVNKLYYNKHKEFSSKEGFDDNTSDFDFFSLPSIRIKGTINDNPGPGQYDMNEKELFGGKFKKIYNMKKNINSNLSKSAKYIITDKKNNINNNSNINNININNDIKEYIFISSAKSNIEKDINSNNNKNNNSALNIKEPLTYRNNESDIMILKNKKNKNISKISGATLETQRSSINSSKLTLTNPQNHNSKILIQNIDNKDLLLGSMKSFNDIMDDTLLNKNFILSAVDINNNEKNNLNQISKFKYDKSKLYKNSYHERMKQIKEKKKIDYIFKNILDYDNEMILNKELYSQNPGPGYYDPILPNNQNYFNKKNMHNNPASKKIIKIEKNIQPESGGDKSMTEKIKKNSSNSSSNILFDIKKIAKLRIAKEKETSERNKKIKLLKNKNSDLNMLKHTYDNNSKEISENQSSIHKKEKIKKLLYNFGTNEKRFKIKTQRIPGVGHYEVYKYKSIEEKNENIIENPNYEELFNKLENKDELMERTPYNKEKINVPPVGMYNPDIISSIKYNFEMKNLFKMTPTKNNKKGYKKLLEKKIQKKVKEIKDKEKELIKLLGPGKYFDILNKTFIHKNKKPKKNLAPFGSNAPKDENGKQDNYPGPGEYDLNSYYNWITRTFNVLFY